MRSLNSLPAACAAFVLLSSAPAVSATECTKDDDCAKDQHCVKVPCATSVCEPGKECPPVPCPDLGTCEANGPGSSCSDDANCPSGFVCEVVGASACAAPGCEPGKECPPAPPCETEEISACVPAPCTDDIQCGPGLSCITFTEEICTGTTVPTCPPGGDCPPAQAAPPACQETSKSICAPPYVAPCKEAADCGEGFDCTPQEQCTCSSGGAAPIPPVPEGESDGSGGSQGDVPAEPQAEEPEDEQCSCSPTGENRCVPKEIACEADGECPDGWSCETAMMPTCVDAPPAPDGSSGGDAGAAPCPPPSSEPSAFCVPPAWNNWGPKSGGLGYAEASGQPGGDAVPAPQAPRAEEADSGCAVAGADASGAGASGALLLLLGLLIARRRTSRSA